MCQVNGAVTVEEYRQRYPNRRYPDHRDLVRIQNNFCEFRKFTEDHHIDRNRNVDLEDDIINEITADPTYKYS